MRISILSIIIFLCGTCCLVSCSSETASEIIPESENKDSMGSEEPSEDAPFYQIRLSETEKRRVETNNRFALDFLHTYPAGNKNVVLSPISVLTALSMLANGDEGDLLNNIMENLHMDIQDLGSLNAYIGKLNEGFQKTYGKTRFCMANSIWAKDGVALRPEFKNIMEEFYSAESMALSGNIESDAHSINEWVSLKTNNLINNFTDPSEVFSMGILNALYFKGGWRNKFDKNLTEEGNFRNMDGSLSRVPFIQTEGKIGYAETDSYSMVGLMLGNGNYRLNLLLPLNGEGNEPPSSISLYEYNELYSRLKETEVKLHLPKFDLSNKSDCMGTLSGMGFGHALTGKYTLIFERGEFKPTQVLHAVTFSIDEEGIQGGAATEVGNVIWNGEKEDPSVPLDITLNRPFLFLLEEVSTGSILFTGEICRF